MCWRIAFLAGLIWWAAVGNLAAQETPPPPPAATAGTDQPAASPGAAPAPAAPADLAAMTKEFDTQYEEWKGIVERLQQLRLEYKSVTPDKKAAMEKEFNQLLARGDELGMKLRGMAETIYKADPQKNLKAGEFVATMAIYAISRDRYEEAYGILNDLTAVGYQNKGIYNYAGIAAFNIGELDKAAEFFRIADEAGALTDEGKDYQLRLEDLRPKWEAEKKIREAEAAAGDLPRVKLTTTKGDIVIELFENEAPNTVANFISLVEKGSYNGVPFHRVLGGFMAQGGDPKGDGTGGPGYRIEDECDQPNHRNHFRGSVSMAKEELPDTGGSQFFICYVPTSHLDGRHTVFGRVIEGLDRAAELQRRNPEKPDPPTPDRIETATVIQKREHPYVPKTLPE